MARKRTVLVAALSAVATWTGTTTPAGANVIGNDSQNFNPTVGSSDYVTVHSSGTLTPGRFSLGLFVNDATNTLPYEDNVAEQSRTSVNDTVVGMDALLAAGVLPGLELGIAAPFMVQQTVEEDETRGEFAEKGNTGFRPVIKFSPWRNDAWGVAILGSAYVNRVTDDPYAGTGGSNTYSLELVGDRHVGRLSLGMNVGYRMHEPGEKLEGALVEPLGDRVLVSTAAAFRFLPRTSGVAEMYAARPTDGVSSDVDRRLDTAETLVGVRQSFRGTALVAHGGIGTELVHGFATPDWRIYAGLTTEFGPGGPRGKTIVQKKKKKAPAVQPEVTPEDDFQAEAMGNDAPAMMPVSLASIPDGPPDEIFILDDINFEFDSDYRVLPGAVDELAKLTKFLEGRTWSMIVIEGHTDYYGTDAYNENLSQRRANTVMRHLVKHYGYDQAHLRSIGFGKRVPRTTDTSDRGRQENRRVELKIYY